MEETIELETTIERNEGILVAEVEDEVIMLHIDEGMYYGLDDIGSHIWTLLEEPLTVRALCERLQERYAITVEQCLEDLLPFLNELHQIGLVHVRADGVA